MSRRARDRAAREIELAPRLRNEGAVGIREDEVFQALDSLGMIAGPPKGPSGLRVSAIRHGGRVWKFAAREAHAENSEELPVASVAVAVMRSGGVTATGSVTLKLALPEPSVLTVVEPR